MTHEYAGTVVAVRSSIAIVTFEGVQQPQMHDVLVVRDAPQVQLEVVQSSAPAAFFCLILTPDSNIARGTRITNTHEQLAIPVGREVLGRAFDIFSEGHDGKGPLTTQQRRPLFSPSIKHLQTVKRPSQIVETGIKPIDFFTPLLKGGKAALVGGAGIGKTVILTELVNRLVVQRRLSGKSVTVFSAVGERSREGQELYEKLVETNTMPHTALIVGQMGESPAVRSRTAYAGATIAEYFRDTQYTDVLFFMDNIFRFAQAGHELATLMNAIPSEDGYQPTLASEMAALQERLISTEEASITSFLALYVPSDDLTDYGVRSVFPYLDTMIVLSRDVFQRGRFPAIDLLTSTSAALSPLYIGTKHYTTYIHTKQTLETAATLERIVSLVGESELSIENQRTYKRAALILNYMVQDLFVGKSAFIPLKETVQTVQDILEGHYDGYDPLELRNIGSIRNLKQHKA